MQNQAQAQAVYQRPIKEFSYYGLQQVPQEMRNVDTENSLRPQSFERKFQYQKSEQLPYATMPFSRKGHTLESALPTKAVNRVCINEKELQVPFYERYWQIWDYTPVKPTCGDVTQDPRYNAEITKTFTAQYKKLVETPGAPPIKTVQPTYGYQTQSK